MLFCIVWGFKVVFLTFCESFQSNESIKIQNCSCQLIFVEDWIFSIQFQAFFGIFRAMRMSQIQSQFQSHQREMPYLKVQSFFLSQSMVLMLHRWHQSNPIQMKGLHWVASDVNKVLRQLNDDLIYIVVTIF